MKMFLAGSVASTPIECDIEDVMDEIWDLPTPEEAGKEPTFLVIENEKHGSLLITKIKEEEWAAVFSGSEKHGLSRKEIEELVKDYFEGKYPQWAKDVDRDDFPDGIDSILEGDF